MCFLARVSLVCVWKHLSLSCVWLFATPWTAACQAPLSKEFSRQYRVGNQVPRIGAGNSALFTHMVQMNSVCKLLMLFHEHLYTLQWSHYRQFSNRETSWIGFFVLCISVTWGKRSRTGISPLLLFPTEIHFNHWNREGFSLLYLSVGGQQLIMIFIDLWPWYL